MVSVVLSSTVPLPSLLWTVGELVSVPAAIDCVSMPILILIVIILVAISRLVSVVRRVHLLFLYGLLLEEHPVEFDVAVVHDEVL